MLEYYFFILTLHYNMGQRANLFEEARNTINVLKRKAASRHTYEMNFPMSIMRVTRRHLHNVSIELINAFEKNDYKVIPALMKRYYKVLTPPSDISGLPYLLHQGEVLSFRDYHKWILRPILGLGRDRYVFPVYHPCWLVTTPGVLISGHIRRGDI